jgi:formylglycine-generating enzyme required for sulfatase activity
MGGKIFINYRRDDDPGFTQALYLQLEDEFPSDDLFMDVEGHIKPGDDFVEVLDAQVVAADLLLVVIGPRWINMLSQRQGDPDDFVVIEIELALSHGKRIIPVLVGGAAMPRANALPEAIRPLARRNAVGLRPDRFKTDCRGLIAALKEGLAAAEQERAAHTEAERKAVEAARLAVEAQAAERARVAEERGRAQAAAGLSAEEIRKAEELASWEFVKDRGRIEDLRDHLARFPEGITERYAVSKLKDLVWAGLGPAATIEQLRAFLDEFPTGERAEVAKARIASLENEAGEAKAAEERRRRETEAWGIVAAGTDKAAIEAFLDEWPNGQHAAAAKRRLGELSRRKTTLGRGILLGIGATLAAAVLVVAGWFGYQRVRLLPTFWDVRPSALRPETERALQPGAVFKECASCPEMVALPPGSFTMGSNEFDSQRPPHRVTIRHKLAVGKFEVTFDDWDACVAHGGCTHRPDDNFWGRGRRPVMNVSWEDAKQYVDWLARLTGGPYRLLSEAEWEYAARAGTTTKFAFGNTISPQQAQFSDRGWASAKQTVPVGTFPPNAWGLHDMHGNVWEWTEDCWHDNYVGAPSEGSAWTTTCHRANHIQRGGSWIGSAVGSAGRIVDTPGRWPILGFRVARTLAP